MIRNSFLRRCNANPNKIALPTQIIAFYESHIKFKRVEETLGDEADDTIVDDDTGVNNSFTLPEATTVSDENDETVGESSLTVETRELIVEDLDEGTVLEVESTTTTIWTNGGEGLSADVVEEAAHAAIDELSASTEFVPQTQDSAAEQ